MQREDIEHLATLSRIRLTEQEIETLPKELSSIIDYVSVVSDMAADEKISEPKVGVVFNVFRKDEITNQPNQYTEDIIKEMPSAKGRFLSVKKILQIEE